MPLFIQSLSHVQLFETPWTAARQALLSLDISRSWLKFMSTEPMMISNRLILCYPFSCPQSFPASGSFSVSWVFTSGGQKIGASAPISPSNEHSGLISFRIDWFYRLVVQRALKSLLQHHSRKASVLQHSALTSTYMTTGKTIALALWTFVSKVMSLLFTMLSKFVIAFLLRCKHLLISQW